MSAPSVAAVTPHAAMLARVHAAAFAPLHRWDAPAMQALIDMPGVFTLLAPEAGGDVAGFIMARTVFDEAEILTFAVDPARRRQGIGRDRGGRCRGVAAQGGARSLFLEVARDNAPALALYGGAGFAQVGLRRDYYPDGMDACVMQIRI